MDALDAYRAAGRGFGLFSKFLFRFEETVGEADERNPAHAQWMRFCLGDGLWIDCPRGMADVLTEVARANKAASYLSTSLDDLPGDWGLVCNAEGAITHRTSSSGLLHAVTYLGQRNGPLATAPLMRNDLYEGWPVKVRDTGPRAAHQRMRG